ncbi:hypothetical protein OIU77_018892 [Salix suchowensis]|uniref:Uncharacterized protein n=1 Tax=Salix suchowensis TaxID=1278906 RepID=A0ABQ9CE45_9ROSI|nr:hypothetical protein OIU77_018892 [Salix suchowensis]
MASLAIETANQEIPDLEKSRLAEKAQWVLNVPDPPSLWRAHGFRQGSCFASWQEIPHISRIRMAFLRQ